MSTAITSFNAFAASHLSLAEGIFTLCHVFALVPILTSLWVLAPKQTAADVFLNFKNVGSPWSSLSLSILTGQSTAFYTLLGSESAVHIAEEIENPATTVPQCMLWSFVWNVPVTILSLLTYLFNINSVEDVVAFKQSPIVFVLAKAFNAREATLTFGVIILLLLFMVTTSTMVATSRHLYAFGRDRALLYSGWISRVNTRLQVPLNAILCTWGFTTVVVALTFASRVSLHIYITMSTACLHGTYVVAIGCLVLKRLRHEGLPLAMWSLGRAGLWVNLAALVYAFWAFFWSFWPTSESVDASNFNWTVLLFLFVLTLAMFMFRQGAKRRERDMRADSSGLLGGSDPSVVGYSPARNGGTDKA